MERLIMDENFEVIKPLCERLVISPSAKNAIELAKHVEKCPSAVIKNLMDYILLSVVTLLNNPDLSNDVKQRLLDVVTAVSLKSRIMKLVIFNNLYVFAVSLIFNPRKPQTLLPLHEGLKQSVVSCIKALIERCTTEVLELIYVSQNIPKLSHGIHMCIFIARFEKSRSLRIAALETAMSLMQVHDKVDTADIVFRSQVADVIMEVLPGATSGLMEVAKGSDVQGHKLTQIAIKAWSRIVALVMEDSPDKSLKFRSPSDMQKFVESDKRTRDWLQFASEKLNIFMSELDSLASHSHFRVRKELATGISLLLTKCPRNMKPSFSKLIEILITLSEDESPEVAEVAKNGLNSVSTKCSEESGMISLVELLEDNFYRLLTTLPRIMRTADDSMQLSYLNQLAAYLRFLGKQILPQVMLSAVHLQRLILALVYVAELECGGISVLEDFSTKSMDVVHDSSSHSWRQFKFINSSSTENKLIVICSLMSELGDFEVLVDTLLKLMFDMPQYRKELILLLNWMVKVPLTNPEKLSLYRKIIDQYIEQDFWYFPIEVSEDTNLRDAQSNLTQSCLLVEGLGNIAEVVKKDYDHFLLKTLYLVLERAGSGHSLLRKVGLEALEKITKSQCDSIPDLLKANVDYISYHVTLKLRRLRRNPGVLDVLGIVMEHSTMDFLPCLKEIVNDVLRRSGEKTQKDDAYSFLRVFYTFAKCVKRLTLKTEMEEETQINEKFHHVEKVIHEVLEYYETKNVAANFGDSGEDNEPICEEEIEEGSKDSEFDYVEEDKELEVPQYVKMIEEVIKRCLHFLPSKDFTVSTLAMTTLNEGLTILAEWESQLLPIVHLTWHPLVDRFRDPNPIVINRAWQLLQTLASVSKDFIKARTLKEILPAISEFLTKSAKESYKKDSGSVYRFTQTFKLQREFLSQLGQVTKDLQLQESQLWEILQICELYLCAFQNKILQESCVALYQEIADYNSDIVWVKCLAIWDKHVQRIGRTPFEVWYSKITESEAQNEYQKNVQTILNYIERKNIS